MDKLIFVNPFQRPTSPRSAKAGTEDRYYRLYEPRRHGYLFPLASMAVAVGFLMFTLNLLP